MVAPHRCLSRMRTSRKLKRPNVSIQLWAPNLARESGQDSGTIGCNALFGTEGDATAFQS